LKWQHYFGPDLGLEVTKDNISNDKTAIISVVLVRFVFNNEINPKHILDDNQGQLF